MACDFVRQFVGKFHVFLTWSNDHTPKYLTNWILNVCPHRTYTCILNSFNCIPPGIESNQDKLQQINELQWKTLVVYSDGKNRSVTKLWKNIEQHQMTTGKAVIFLSKVPRPNITMRKKKKKSGTGTWDMS